MQSSVFICIFPLHTRGFSFGKLETKFDERTTNFTDYMGKEMESLIKKNNGNRSSLHNVVKGAAYMLLSTSILLVQFFVYSSLNDRDHRSACQRQNIKLSITLFMY